MTVLVIGLFLCPSISLGQARAEKVSDFTADVQFGLQNLETNPVAQAQEKDLQAQDYKSMWDEFGINVLVDGATPPPEINKEIIQDILRAVRTEQNYDQQEASYLEAAKITPQDIKAVEESTGSDVSPSESLNPNPSLETNPNVSIFSAESSDQAPEVQTENINQSTSTKSTQAPEVQTENINQSTSTKSTNEILTETSFSTLKASTSSEKEIFDAILGGEEAQSIDQTEASSSQPGVATPEEKTTPPVPRLR